MGYWYFIPESEQLKIWYYENASHLWERMKFCFLHLLEFVALLVAPRERRSWELKADNCTAMTSPE